MRELSGKTALVTGGSRGLGRAIVQAFAGHGAKVVAVARNQARLDALREEVRGEVETVSADVSDETVASDLLERYRPDIIVLAAGDTPHMAPIHEQTWEQFTAIWNNDVKQTFHFGTAALKTPLGAGSRVLIVSSGAGLGGSPLSGGYAGAKRMQMFLANYFQGVSNQLDRGVRFQTLVPKQIVADTDLGRAASMGYAEHQGISQAKFLERFGTPLRPDAVGQAVVAVVTGAELPDASAIAISGDGLASLD